MTVSEERSLKMKKTVILAILFVFLFSVAFEHFGYAASQEKIVIRFAHGYPTSYIRHRSAMKWAWLLEKITKNQVEVKLYPAGQLFKTAQLLEAVMMGNVDIIATHGGNPTQLVPEWGFFMMPFFWWPSNVTDYSTAWKFKQSDFVQKKLVPKVEQRGLKFIGFMNALAGGGEFSTTKVKITKIDDFKGLKMQTSGGWLRHEAVKALGATAVTIPRAEIATGLAQGTIDGEFGTTTNVLASGYPVKYIHNWPSWVADTGACFLMNKKKWDSLPADIKYLIDQVVTPETQDWTNHAMVIDEINAKIALEKRGMIFVEPDPGTEKAIQKRCSFLLDKFAKRFGSFGREMVDVARSLLPKAK